MRKNYFVKLLKYTKDVDHTERGIRKLKDARIYPKYKIPQVILPLLIGLMLRIKSIKVSRFMKRFSKCTMLIGFSAL